MPNGHRPLQILHEQNAERIAKLVGYRQPRLVQQKSQVSQAGQGNTPVGMHLSSVVRRTSGKYMSTPMHDSRGMAWPASELS